LCHVRQFGSETDGQSPWNTKEEKKKKRKKEAGKDYEGRQAYYHPDLPSEYLGANSKRGSKVELPITTLICNLNILGPIPRGAHIFQRCACFTNQTQLELEFSDQKCNFYEFLK